MLTFFFIFGNSSDFDFCVVTIVVYIPNGGAKRKDLYWTSVGTFQGYKTEIARKKVHGSHGKRCFILEEDCWLIFSFH